MIFADAVSGAPWVKKNSWGGGGEAIFINFTVNCENECKWTEMFGRKKLSLNTCFLKIFVLQKKKKKRCHPKRTHMDGAVVWLLSACWYLLNAPVLFLFS